MVIRRQTEEDENYPPIPEQTLEWTPTFKFNPDQDIVFDYRMGYGRMAPGVSAPVTARTVEATTAQDYLMRQKRIDPGKYSQILGNLWSAGYISGVKSIDELSKVRPDEAQRAWINFLGYVQNEQRITPEGEDKPDAMGLLFREGNTYRVIPTGRAGGGGGPFRSETTSVTEYDEKNVMDIANNAYSQILGRKATKKERQALAQILNQEQRKAPRVTISEGTTSGGMMTGEDGQRTARGTVSTTTTRGGIVPSELAQQEAVQAEDFEERFFVSTFSDMLQELSRPF